MRLNTCKIYHSLIIIFEFSSRSQSGYGMTEVSPIHFLSKPEDDETLITTTIGCPLDHSEVDSTASIRIVL